MKLKRRNSKGSVAIEFVAGCFLMVPMLFLVTNATIAVLALGEGERACRDAARAAAQCETSAAADRAAHRAVAMHGSKLFSIELLPVRTGSNSVVDYQDMNGNPLAYPSVTVRTQSSVKLVYPAVSDTTIHFEKSYTFPIIPLNPPTATATNSTPVAPMDAAS